LAKKKLEFSVVIWYGGMEQEIWIIERLGRNQEDVAK
jgi:hypothetical protein